jgi:hypothetical protein
MGDLSSTAQFLLGMGTGAVILFVVLWLTSNGD